MPGAKPVLSAAAGHSLESPEGGGTLQSPVTDPLPAGLGPRVSHFPVSHRRSRSREGGGSGRIGRMLR